MKFMYFDKVLGYGFKIWTNCTCVRIFSGYGLREAEQIYRKKYGIQGKRFEKVYLWDKNV